MCYKLAAVSFIQSCALNLQLCLGNNSVTGCTAVPWSQNCALNLQFCLGIKDVPSTYNCVYESNYALNLQLGCAAVRGRSSREKSILVSWLKLSH